MSVMHDNFPDTENLLEHCGLFLSEIAEVQVLNKLIFLFSAIEEKMNNKKIISELFTFLRRLFGVRTLIV